MRIRDRSTVYLYSISVCMGSFVFGYQLTSFGHLLYLLPQANEFVDEQHFNSMSSFLNSIMPLAAIFGVSFYRCLLKTFGYLTLFQYIDYVTILAAFIGALNLSISTQIFSRLLLGVIVGLNTIMVPTYLTSCIPGSMGGPAGSLNQLFITIGIFFGFLMGLTALDATIHSLAWRLVIALPIIPALIRIYTTSNIFPYESVELMIETNNDFLLRRYIDHIWQEVTVQEFKASKKMDQEDIAAQNANYFDQIGDSFRRRFNLICFVIFFNQFSGSSATFALARHVFPQVVGFQASDVTWSFVKLTFLQVVVTFLTGQFLEKYGRRAFMLEGQRIILVVNILIGLIEYAAPQIKGVQYFLIFVHIIGFSLSFGPCSFVIITEINHDITYPSILFWILIFSFGLINESLIGRYGASSLFFFFSIVTLFGIFYIASYLVETQGKPRQQVYKEYRDMSFPLPLKWRKFLTKRNTASDCNVSLIPERGTLGEIS